MSLLFDCGWWTLCPLARPDSDMGQWVVPTQQLFWFGAEVPWIPGDKALFVSLNPLPDTQPLNSRCCQPEQWGQATCSPSAWPEMPSCQENRDRSSCSNLIIHHCQASCCLPKMGQHRQSTFSGGRCYLGLLVGIGVMGEYKRPTARRVLIPQLAVYMQTPLGPAYTGWLLGLCGHYPISEDSDWFFCELFRYCLSWFSERASEADRHWQCRPLTPLTEGHLPALWFEEG